MIAAPIATPTIIEAMITAAPPKVAHVIPPTVALVVEKPNIADAVV